MFGIKVDDINSRNHKPIDLSTNRDITELIKAHNEASKKHEDKDIFWC